MAKTFNAQIREVSASDLAQAIAIVRNDLRQERIVKLTIGSETYWMKQGVPDNDTPATTHLEQGACALQSECDTLLNLFEKGVPVPAVVYHQSGFFVISDCDLDLRDLLRARAPDRPR